MANKEIHSTVSENIVMVSQDFTPPTTIIGGIVDTRGYEAMTFLMRITKLAISPGANPIFELIVADSETQGDFVVVDNEFIITANNTIDGDGGLVTVSYIGKKRFVQPKLISVITIGSANMNITMTLLGGFPHHIPSADPFIILP